MIYQWTYDYSVNGDYNALLVNEGSKVVGMVTGEMADAIYHILSQPPEMNDTKKFIVASQIALRCTNGHSYNMSEGSCPGCAEHAGIIDDNLNQLIKAAKIACHNHDYKNHEALRDALNPFQDNPK